MFDPWLKICLVLKKHRMLQQHLNASCSKTMNNLVAVSKHTRIWCERKLDNNRFGKSFEKPDAKN